MHPTELIYKNAVNRKIHTPKGVEVDYSFQEGQEEGNCYICNRKTTKGKKKNEVIKNTFTNQELCLNRISDIVCEYCSFYLNFSQMRNYAIFATESEFRHPAISDFKNIIINLPKEQFIICIPTSGQKWIALFSKVNFSDEFIQVSLETNVIKFRKKDFFYLMNKVEEVYNSEFKLTKEEIKTLEFNSSKILKMGLDRYKKIISDLEKYKNTKLMELCCVLAQKEEKK